MPLPDLERRGTARDECRLRLGNAVGKGESELGLEELFDVWATDVVCFLDLDDAENVDRPESGTVSCCHVLVERFHGVGAAEFAELLVHVVCARAGVVTEPNTEVLDLQRLLLVYHGDIEYLTARLLHFLELPQEIPETRLGDDFVRRKDAHAVDFWGGI